MTVLVPPGSCIGKSTATAVDIIVVIVCRKLHATVNRTKKDVEMKQPITITMIIIITTITQWNRHKKQSDGWNLM